MNSVIQILLEGRDAPLYHTTTVLSAYKILSTDKLIPGQKYSDITGDKRNTISFTRDKLYSYDGDCLIQLKFDQRKLAYNYKFVPIAEPGYSRESGWTESEERLITKKPIPVRKYLLEIELSHSFESDLKARLGYIYDTPRNRWDADDKALYQIWRWWEDNEFPFGKRIDKVFRWFMTVINKDLYGDEWENHEIQGGMDLD